MKKNYESESKTNKNYTNATDKNTTSKNTTNKNTCGSETNCRTENKSVNETKSRK